MSNHAEMCLLIRGRANWLAMSDEKVTSSALAAEIGSGNFMILTKPTVAPGYPNRALSVMGPLPSVEFELPDTDRTAKRVYFPNGAAAFIEGEDIQFIKIFLCGHFDKRTGRDWAVINDIVDWRHKQFSNCEVWYGGDNPPSIEHPSVARLG